MVKLQQIERKNGSVVSSINIPLDIIQDSGWERGEELEIETNIDENSFQIIISGLKRRN